MKDAFIIGLAQACAVMPGLSRSGSTIATGLLLGNKKEKLAQFSFLMVIPPILGEALLDVLKAVKGEEAFGDISVLPLVVGFVAAFVSGCLACRLDDKPRQERQAHLLCSILRHRRSNYRRLLFDVNVIDYIHYYIYTNTY